MKHVKLRTFSFFLLLCLLAMFSGCEEPEEIDRSDRYIGTYRVYEECGSLVDEYTLIVSRGNMPNRVEITNLFDGSMTGVATIMPNGDWEFNEIQAGSYFAGLPTCRISAHEGRGQIIDDELTLSFRISLSRLAANPPQCSDFTLNCIVVGYR